MKQNAYDMTKHLSRVLSLLLCSAVLWTACSSDDDDDDGGGGSASALEAGVYEGEDGVSYQLTAFDDEEFEYDEQGNLIAITGGMDGDYEVTPSPFKIYRENQYGTITISNFSFNAQGYITKCTVAEIYDYDDEYGESKSVYSLSYNGSGQLTTISIEGSDVVKEDGETYKVSGTENISFTYENGNLVSIKESGKGKEDGETYTFSAQSTLTYGSTVNVARQYTYGVAYSAMDIDDQIADLAVIGYLGKASNYLPTQIAYTSEYSDDDDYDVTHQYSYTLGSTHSLVVQEKEGYHTRNYKYASDTKAVDVANCSVEQTETNAPARRRHGVLRHRMGNK